MAKRRRYNSLDKGAWQQQYLAGITFGAQKYMQKKDYMLANYTAWIDYVQPIIVDTLRTVPDKVQGDPVGNWLRRGAPFVRRFIEASKSYKAQKMSRMVAPRITLLPPPAPA